MVKFTQDFQKLIKPEWKRRYVDYIALSDMIHELTEAEKAGSDTKGLESDYLLSLNRMARRANRFYKKQLELLRGNFPLAIKFNESEAIVVKRSNKEVKMPYRLKAFEVELSEHYVSVRELSWFCELNLSALHRSIKKARKKTNIQGTGEVFHKIKGYVFSDHAGISKLMRKAIILHSNVFTDLNVVKSKQILSEYWKREVVKRYNLENVRATPIKESALDIWKEMSSFLESETGGSIEGVD